MFLIVSSVLIEWVCGQSMPLHALRKIQGQDYVVMIIVWEASQISRLSTLLNCCSYSTLLNQMLTKPWYHGWITVTVMLLSSLAHCIIIVRQHTASIDNGFCPSARSICPMLVLYWNIDVYISSNSLHHLEGPFLALTQLHSSKDNTVNGSIEYEGNKI